MKMSQVMVAAVSTMVAAGACAAEPKMTGTKVWNQPTYTLYSHNEKAARTVMSEIVPIDQVLSTLLGQEASPSHLPTYILIVRDSVWDRYLRPSPMIAAEFVPARF